MFKPIFIIVLISMCMSSVIVRAEGAEVNIILFNGNEISGELLYVDEDSVYITIQKSAEEFDLIHGKAGIRIFPNDSIKVVYVIGQSFVLLDASIGLFGGILAGAIIGVASAPDKSKDISGLGRTLNVVRGGCLGGLFGLIVGVIIGISNSEPDTKIERSKYSEFLKLIKYARYKTKPSYL